MDRDAAALERLVYVAPDVPAERVQAAAAKLAETTVHAYADCLDQVIDALAGQWITDRDLPRIAATGELFPSGPAVVLRWKKPAVPMDPIPWPSPRRQPRNRHERRWQQRRAK